MSAPPTTQGQARVQSAALGTVRVAGLLVGVAAVAIGIAFATVTAIGPSVWEFSTDGSGAGTLTRMPPILRLVHAAAVLLTCLTIGVSAILVSALARRAGAGVRFLPTLTRTVIALSVTIGAGSWLAQVATTTARWSWPLNGTDEISWAPLQQTLLPNWALLGVAIILGILAVIVSAGERLQRDTEGLV